jgi:hypothetical protein
MKTTGLSALPVFCPDYLGCFMVSHVAPVSLRYHKRVPIPRQGGATPVQGQCRIFPFSTVFNPYLCGAKPLSLQYFTR